MQQSRLAKKLSDPSILFDREEHRYTRTSDGLVIPSVTQILKLKGLTADKFYKDNGGKERGAMVHGAVEHYAENGFIPWDEVDESITHEIDQFLQFVKDSKLEIQYYECIVYSKQYSYCGMFDMIATINGSPYLLDIKTGSSIPAYVGLQTAAYEYARTDGNPILQRAALHIPRAGSYKLKECENESDYDIWISICKECCNLGEGYE